MSKSGYVFLLWLGLLSFNSQAVPNDSDSLLKQQIIGTQAIGAKYHFTSDDPVVEQAKRILDMGSKMIKISAKEGPVLDAILDMPFDTYFFWWRSDGKIWENGLSAPDKAKEYKATYSFAKKLLTRNAQLERTFYLGNWEGDWYLIDPKNQIEPSQKKIQGMIDWFNIRQKAVEDARKDVGANSLAKVYLYAEVNRVRDAMVFNKARVVNKVLPKTNVDYVSYSSYDVQQEPVDVIKQTLNYIEDKLPKKTGINGRRVFIGECGIQAKLVGFNPQKHEKVNRDIFIKFLQTNVPFILYWEMYNNEVENNEHQGFWLINEKDQKQPLYDTLEALYTAQKDFKDIRKQSIQWLEEKRN
ncbi:hypothetical protein FOLKNPGA_02753 [Legionella sp. PC1000]|uniref:hypothetical protein n=1 Tax=Legionella sp. PC1000 TaxID=2746060 RepID=UPI0015FC4ECD|nr:hypothetical protein [Legionella sp. PC1000]QLZ69953.1 hypothetical protein FOLKNPGA_02753 [Legionella sp. PC1000]